MYYFRYLLINKHNKKLKTHSVNAKKLNFSTHLLYHLPHCLHKQTPFMPHLWKVPTKGHNSPKLGHVLACTCNNG